MWANEENEALCGDKCGRVTASLRINIIVRTMSDRRRLLKFETLMNQREQKHLIEQVPSFFRLYIQDNRSFIERLFKYKHFFCSITLLSNLRMELYRRQFLFDVNPERC